MKTITLKSDDRSILVAKDADTVSLELDHLRRNDERIYGLGQGTATLHEGVDIPADWQPSRYLFDGKDWTENPKWVDYRKLWGD